MSRTPSRHERCEEVEAPPPAKVHTFSAMDWLVGCVALVHLAVAPYTKVEESFNLQACHDLLYNGAHLSQYDHLEYPGVVPRTFVGPLVVSGISYPLVGIVKLLSLSKFISQYIVRGVLGLLVVLAWRRFRKQVQEKFGSSVTFWFTLITASQFHFMYYLSRPLPNTFALVVALLTFSYWLEQRHGALIWSSGVAVLIFRSELCLLLGPMLLLDLTTRRLLTVPFLKYAIPAGLLCLVATLAIDSFFWQRLLWPEGEVFWFNTYKNQSQAYGTSPFLWYWYSALPRALGLSLLLVPVGIALDKRLQVMVTPAFIFVAAYSILPHKELRFIIYVFPILNVAAARACHYFWEGRDKSTWRQIFAAGSALHLVANVAFTTLLLTISCHNYPGGIAMQKLHQLVPQDANVSVHIDNFAAQTGISRFTQLYDHWRYDKTEHLKAGSEQLRAFTHMLVEGKSKYAYNLKHYTTSHQTLTSIQAFSHLSFNYQQFPPVKVRVKPSIFILKNLVDEDIDWSWLEEEEEEEEELQQEEEEVIQEEESEEEVEKNIQQEEEEGEEEEEIQQQHEAIEDEEKLAGEEKGRVVEVLDKDEAQKEISEEEEEQVEEVSEGEQVEEISEEEHVEEVSEEEHVDEEESLQESDYKEKEEEEKKEEERDDDKEPEESDDEDLDGPKLPEEGCFAPEKVTGVETEEPVGDVTEDIVSEPTPELPSQAQETERGPTPDLPPQVQEAEREPTPEVLPQAQEAEREPTPEVLPQAQEAEREPTPEVLPQAQEAEREPTPEVLPQAQEAEREPTPELPPQAQETESEREGKEEERREEKEDIERKEVNGEEFCAKPGDSLDSDCSSVEAQNIEDSKENQENIEDSQESVEEEAETHEGKDEEDHARFVEVAFSHEAEVISEGSEVSAKEQSDNSHITPLPLSASNQERVKDMIT